jgi:hypothetical protein
MTGSVLPPLTLAVPLLAAAVLAGTQFLSQRLIAETVALAAAVATTVICALELALAIRHGEVVYWFGGWHAPGTAWRSGSRLRSTPTVRALPASRAC